MNRLPIWLSTVSGVVMNGRNVGGYQHRAKLPDDPDDTTRSPSLSL